ncbi:MAG: protein kinase, partial [Gemmatimonadetes bacterium]|nr:protein kinase [Gemmatimonadota bacterium]
MKLLSPELVAGVNVERFKREIQMAARLQHPHIVPVITAGDSEGLPWYTMPFVEGESLRAKLSRQGALGIGETITILRDVARALDYAHDQGIVHRDIKPDNVLLSRGVATVADFGIAKAISASRTQESGASLTQIGVSIGTPMYMAPEQAAGDPDVDHRADIYAYGCVAYEMLAGHGPFSAKTPQRLIAAHMTEIPLPVSELRPDTPRTLADLVMRCLEKDPAARPSNAAELLTVLEAATSEGAQTAAPPLLLAGRGMLWKALALYALAVVVVAIIARAAIVALGLPDWVFPGAMFAMALALPAILFTGYAQRVTRRAFTETPTYTPGGTPSLVQGTMATIAFKASPHLSWRRTARWSALALAAFVLLMGARTHSAPALAVSPRQLGTSAGRSRARWIRRSGAACRCSGGRADGEPHRWQ